MPSTILTVVLGLTLASAAAVDRSLLVRRDLGVLICKDTQGNDCQQITLPPGECHGMGGDFDNKLSSIRMDPGVACDLFGGNNCSDMIKQGLQGAVGNFGDVANDKTSSMACYPV